VILEHSEHHSRSGDLAFTKRSRQAPGQPIHLGDQSILARYSFSCSTEILPVSCPWSRHPTLRLGQDLPSFSSCIVTAITFQPARALQFRVNSFAYPFARESIFIYAREIALRWGSFSRARETSLCRPGSSMNSSGDDITKCKFGPFIEAQSTGLDLRRNRADPQTIYN